MKISNLGYLLKEGIRGIFLRGFMSFAAVCVTVACLVIVGSFASLVYNVSVIVEDLNETSEIRVFIDETLSDAEAKSVHTKINQLGDNIKECVFVSKEQALEDFVADHDYDPAFDGLEPDYLRHRCVVVLEDNTQMRETADAILAVPGVADITAEFELAEGFSMVQQVLQVVSIAVISVLLVVSLLIISNTVKLAMYDRRDEIAIMKMVGATNGFIRFPFMVEGFILGMLGAAIAFGLEWLMYDGLVAKINELEGEMELFSFVPFETLLVPMVCTFAAAGLFVGIVGSWTSIRKFMDV
ncbi:MAG: permease-like cell division protein FtsX [Oscillospiraceae bacterium]|nr:permease-like cell division protein FtsX [Oscillospiraceae bacterium]